MRISDWSSDVCSSDLAAEQGNIPAGRSASKCNGMTMVWKSGVTEGGATIVMAIDDFGVLVHESCHVIQHAEKRSRREAECYAVEARAPECFERSAEHTSELQSLMRISYAVFCLKNKN